MEGLLVSAHRKYTHIPLCKGLYVLKQKDRSRYKVWNDSEERKEMEKREVISYYLVSFYYTLIYCSVHSHSGGTSMG